MNGLRNVFDASLGADIKEVHRSLLAFYISTAQRIQAAKISNSLDLLRALAASQHWLVRQAVANNRISNPQILDLLATDVNPDVRMAVANNPIINGKILDSMCNDPDPGVLVSVVMHELVPIIALAKIVNNKKNTAIADLAQNKLIDKLDINQSSWWPEEGVRKWLSIQIETPATMLVELASDNSPAVRRTVAAHPYLPTEATNRLITDEDVSVQTVMATRGDIWGIPFARLIKNADPFVQKLALNNQLN